MLKTIDMGTLVVLVRIVGFEVAVVVVMRDYSVRIAYIVHVDRRGVERLCRFVVEVDLRGNGELVVHGGVNGHGPVGIGGFFEKLVRFGWVAFEAFALLVEHWPLSLALVVAVWIVVPFESRMDVESVCFQ